MNKTLHLALTMFFPLIVASAFGQQSGVPAPQSNSGNRVIRLQAEESAFNPSRKRALSYRGGGLAIKLTNGKKSLAIEVVNGSQPPETVQLPSEIAQVNGIWAGPTGKVIIVGMVNGSVFEVVILTTNPPALSDAFLAYSPSVSPDGRFVAFVKFYPAHFVDGTEDHYLLYDTFKSASENRVGGSGSDHTNVGQPVYPRVPNREGDNTDVSRAQHHMMAQGFFWQSDSTRYAFADDHDGDWIAFVISVGKGTPESRSAPLSRTDFCAALHKETCHATLAGAELTPNGVLLDLQGVGVDSSVTQLIRYDNQEFQAVQ